MEGRPNAALNHADPFPLLLASSLTTDGAHVDVGQGEVELSELYPAAGHAASTCDAPCDARRSAPQKEQSAVADDVGAEGAQDERETR